MKLVTAIVPSDAAGEVLDALTRRGYRVTRVPTAGAFFRAVNTTLLIGVEDEQVEKVLDLLHTGGMPRRSPRAAEVGTIVFVLPVERFERL